MAKSTNKHKTTNDKFNLPEVTLGTPENKLTLPFNGSAVTEKSFSFSFACFDRSHDLFNLGDTTADKVVSGKWFLDLMDCFKSVSNMTSDELKKSMHDLHPIDWSKANAKPPQCEEQHEYWQFRINKSKGRVIGFLIRGIFYVIWLDPHHNLTDSEGYGTATKYKAPLSLFEQQCYDLQSKDARIKYLEEELKAAEDLLNEK